MLLSVFLIQEGLPAASQSRSGKTMALYGAAQPLGYTQPGLWSLPASSLPSPHSRPLKSGAEISPPPAPKPSLLGPLASAQHLLKCLDLPWSRGTAVLSTGCGPHLIPILPLCCTLLPVLFIPDPQPPLQDGDSMTTYLSLSLQ